MAIRFLDKKTHSFYYTDNGKEKILKLIFGDEVETLPGEASKGPRYTRVRFRNRTGQWKTPPLSKQRPLEMYFLDVGQGDAAFFVTPEGKKILVDGGLKTQALHFLIWRYRLDKPGQKVKIDHLILSHADKDHVEGLIPLLKHPRVTVDQIWHNGIGLFAKEQGFNEPIGQVTGGRLLTLHNGLDDLQGMALADTPGAVFKDWIEAVGESGAAYGRLDRSMGQLDIGDPTLQFEITSPILESDNTFRWFANKAHTINGHSLTFRLTYKRVRTFFSGDLNIEGGDYLCDVPGGPLSVNSHIFKTPHHGSHEFSNRLLSAVNPMLSVVSSGEIPDHGHPRANFLGRIGAVSRGPEPLLFSTAMAALFQDADEAPDDDGLTTLEDLDVVNTPSDNVSARKRFKKTLNGIINVRTDGNTFYAFRRVQQKYQWESYGPIKPIN